MLYPDLRRLALVRPTGMEAAAPSEATAPFFNTNEEQSRAAAEVTRRVEAAREAAQENVVNTWSGLTPQQQGAVIELLKLEKERRRNDSYAANASEKTKVIKGMRHYESLLPANLQERAWRNQPWQVVLNGPEHRELFEAVDQPGFYGWQIGEDEPNQPKDYSDRRDGVFNPYGGWDTPRYYTPWTGAGYASRPTGAFNDDYQRERQARLAWEAYEASRELGAPPGAPPAPPPPDRQPELNVWNGLNAAQQNIVLLILAEIKKLREYRYGYDGHGIQVPDSVAKAVDYYTAQLPPALNTPAKFKSVNWELALSGMPEYNYVFGLGGYRGD